MDPDENLPWPDQDLIKKWWIARQGNFAKGRNSSLISTAVLTQNTSNM